MASHITLDRLSTLSLDTTSYCSQSTSGSGRQHCSQNAPSIHVAACNADLEALQQRLREGVSPDATDPTLNLRTPLHSSTGNSNWRICACRTRSYASSLSSGRIRDTPANPTCDGVHLATDCPDRVALLKTAAAPPAGRAAATFLRNFDDLCSMMTPVLSFCILFLHPLFCRQFFSTLLSSPLTFVYASKPLGASVVVVVVVVGLFEDVV